MFVRNIGEMFNGLIEVRESPFASKDGWFAARNIAAKYKDGVRVFFRAGEKTNYLGAYPVEAVEYDEKDLATITIAGRRDQTHQLVTPVEVYTRYPVIRGDGSETVTLRSGESYEIGAAFEIYSCKYL